MTNSGGTETEFCAPTAVGSAAWGTFRILLARAIALALALALALAVILVLAATSSAHEPDAGGLPPLLRQTGFDPPLSGAVPPELPFQDEDGAAVRLGDYVRDKPVILALVYYGCAMLCNQTLEALARSLRAVPFEAGREFAVVAVSFDPQETPAAAKAKKEDFREWQRPSGIETGWHFLTGEESSIIALTQAAGFRYAYDAERKLFAHASGVLILTPEGRISRYLPGVEYAPRDLRLALVEASQNKIGTPADRLLLFCYEYDPVSGKYGAAVMRLVRWGGIVTIFGLVISIVLFWRREEKSSPPVSASGWPA
ncbi:MAG: SCO family protein [Acidobacteria bacterium]|nr:SCO family protein [Acidobacteriota bacterium]